MTCRPSAALLLLVIVSACGDSGGSSSGTGTGTDSGTGTGGTAVGSTGAPTTGGFEGDPVLYQGCLDHFAAVHAGPALACECKVANGEYPTVDACVEATGLKFGEEVTCFCEIVARVPASSGFLDCYRAPDEQHIACLEPLACEDTAGQDACSDVYIQAILDCPELPNSVSYAEEVLCASQPGFDCADGLPIPDYRRCDGNPDCGDGSDEQGCP